MLTTETHSDASVSKEVGLLKIVTCTNVNKNHYTDGRSEVSGKDNGTCM